MTNQEYFELINAECEDCQWYGSKCHCQYEQEEATMQDWYDRGFKFGLSERQQQLADLEARNAGLVDYLDELLEQIENQKMLTTMWKDEANNQRKNAARWQFEYNRAIRR